MNYPQGWDTFWQLIRENPNITFPPNLNHSELNRFAARFRLAQSYQGMNLDGYPEQSIEAYSSLLGVFLSYSAIEQLYKALGNPGKDIVEEWAIDEPEIAKKLRRFTKILTFLHAQVNPKLKQRIDEFRQQENKNHNILIIAQALRHLVAHGMMTIHAGDVKPQTTIDFCNSVRQCVNNKTQICFTEYVLNRIIASTK